MVIGEDIDEDSRKIPLVFVIIHASIFFLF